MAVTAKQTAKTLSVGTTAVTFTPVSDLGADVGAMHRWLRVKNRGTAEIGVHDAGGTASINGDDVVHIAPGGSEIFDVTVLSIICAVALTYNVEVCGDKGRLR